MYGIVLHLMGQRNEYRHGVGEGEEKKVMMTKEEEEDCKGSCCCCCCCCCCLLHILGEAYRATPHAPLI